MLSNIFKLEGMGAYGPILLAPVGVIKFNK